MTPWSEIQTLTRFSPETSLYHSILEKKYGTPLAMQMLGLQPLRHLNRKPVTRYCRLCGKSFQSKSGRKVYCGRQDEEGTCSYTYNRNRLGTKLKVIKQNFGQQTQKASVEAV